MQVLHTFVPIASEVDGWSRPHWRRHHFGLPVFPAANQKSSWRRRTTVAAHLASSRIVVVMLLLPSAAGAVVLGGDGLGRPQACALPVEKFSLPPQAKRIATIRRLEWSISSRRAHPGHLPEVVLALEIQTYLEYVSYGSVELVQSNHWPHRKCWDRLEHPAWACSTY